MHGKAIEYELLINLCLFSIKKKSKWKKKKNPTMKEEFKLLLIQCC